MSVISSDLVDRLGQLPAQVAASELSDPSALGEALSAFGYFDGNIYDASSVSEATARFKSNQGLATDDLVDPAFVVHLITAVTNGVITGQLQEADNTERVDLAELAVMDFPPQAVGGTVDLDDPKGIVPLVDAVRRDLHGRLGDWVDYVMMAVGLFQDDAKTRLGSDPLFNEGDAEVGLSGVVMAFGEAVMSYMPGVGQFTGAIRQSFDILGGLQANFKSDHLGVAGAMRKLENALNDLHAAALATLSQFKDTFQPATGQSVLDSPLGQAVWEALTWVEEASTDPDYVSALVDWIMEPPTSENTTQPIRDALNRAFDEEYRAVAAQLMREQGYDVNTY